MLKSGSCFGENTQTWSFTKPNMCNSFQFSWECHMTIARTRCNVMLLLAVGLKHKSSVVWQPNHCRETIISGQLDLIYFELVQSTYFSCSWFWGNRFWEVSPSPRGGWGSNIIPLSGGTHIIHDAVPMDFILRAPQNTWAWNFTPPKITWQQNVLPPQKYKILKYLNTDFRIQSNRPKRICDPVAGGM